jgi:hypothetical protein
MQKMTAISMALLFQIETRVTRVIMDQDQTQIPPPPVEYTPQWLDPEPPLEPPPARYQPRFQFEEKNNNFVDNKLIIGIAIGVIVMGVLMTMRPMVIHGK